MLNPTEFPCPAYFVSLDADGVTVALFELTLVGPSATAGSFIDDHGDEQNGFTLYESPSIALQMFLHDVRRARRNPQTSEASRLLLDQLEAVVITHMAIADAKTGESRHA